MVVLTTIRSLPERLVMTGLIIRIGRTSNELRHWCTVSYKFNGSSINYDKVKTISIADFPIKSEYVYAPLATRFNEDLKDIFVRQTRLQLLKPNQNADLQIDGEITGYNQYNLSLIHI